MGTKQTEIPTLQWTQAEIPTLQQNAQYFGNNVSTNQILNHVFQEKKHRKNPMGDISRKIV